MEVLAYVDTKVRDLRFIIYDIIERGWKYSLYLRYKDYYILKKGMKSCGKIIVFDAVCDDINGAIKMLENETGYRYYVGGEDGKGKNS